MTEWFSTKTCPPQGAGGQVWVAYRSPHYPTGWRFRVQWTPLVEEIGTDLPEFWMPVDYPQPPTETTMPDYMQRVGVEKADLDAKIDKLDAFMAGKVFAALPIEERARLCRQAYYMRSYSAVLGERIQAAM